MQLFYISSCVLVREEGVNGLLDIAYSGKKTVTCRKRGALYVRVIDFRVRQLPMSVVVGMVVRGGRAENQYARRFYPHGVRRSLP